MAAWPRSGPRACPAPGVAAPGRRAATPGATGDRRWAVACWRPAGGPVPVPGAGGRRGAACARRGGGRQGAGPRPALAVRCGVPAPGELPCSCPRSPRRPGRGAARARGGDQPSRNCRCLALAGLAHRGTAGPRAPARRVARARARPGRFPAHWERPRARRVAAWPRSGPVPRPPPGGRLVPAPVPVWRPRVGGRPVLAAVGERPRARRGGGRRGATHARRWRIRCGSRRRAARPGPPVPGAAAPPGRSAARARGCRRAARGRARGRRGAVPCRGGGPSRTWPRSCQVSPGPAPAQTRPTH
jgi:hypothetical protein